MLKPRLRVQCTHARQQGKKPFTREPHLVGASKERLASGDLHSLQPVGCGERFRMSVDSG